MPKICRYLLPWLLLLWASAVSAVIPSVVRYQYATFTGTASEIVSQAQASSPTTNCGGGVTRPNTWYSKNETAASVDIWVRRDACPGYSNYDAFQFSAGAIGSGCPANSTAVSGGCQCTAPYIEQGSSCVDPDQACKSQQGQTATVNWTVGYTRTANIDADPNWTLVGPPNVIPSNKQACYQGCSVGLGDATMAYQSVSPTSTGLYRISMDLTATYGGSSCGSGASDGPLNPQQPIPPCPGFVGEVNGKLGCYGTAEKPVRDDKPAEKPPAPLDKGNPSAGKKPESGEGAGNGGAGRTPSNGNGGPAGGPAGAAGGTKPDGLTDKPTDDKKEQQNCGAPGQPKCGIDETGTPGNWGEGKWDSKIADYKAKAEQSLNQIKQSGGETFNPFRDFFFAPPLAACEPFVLPNDQGEITRHCEVVEGVRSIMAYVWALAALWICLGWIKKATA